MTQQERKGWRL